MARQLRTVSRGTHSSPAVSDVKMVPFCTTAASFVPSADEAIEYHARDDSRGAHVAPKSELT